MDPRTQADAARRQAEAERDFQQRRPEAARPDILKQCEDHAAFMEQFADEYERNQGRYRR